MPQNETVQENQQGQAATPPAAKPNIPDVTFAIGSSGELEPFIPKTSSTTEPDGPPSTKPSVSAGKEDSPEVLAKRARDTRDDWTRLKNEYDGFRKDTSAKMEALMAQNQQLLTHVATQQTRPPQHQQNAPLTDDQLAELQSDPRKMLAFIGAYTNHLVQNELSRIRPTIATIEERLQFEKAAGATPGYEAYIPDMVKVQNAVADKLPNVSPVVLFEIVKALKGDSQGSVEAAATGSQQAKRDNVSEQDIRRYIDQHSTERGGVSGGDAVDAIESMPTNTFRQAWDKVMARGAATGHFDKR